MIVLRKYQRKKVDELRQHTSRLLTEFEDIPNKTIVFQAPTGSGKTIMMAQYIQEYFTLDAADASVCFLWLSIGKGKVHEQSKKSLDKFFKGDPSVSLYEESYLSVAARLEERSVTVVNWEKLNNKDGETKEWKNKAMRKAADFHNFTEVMRNTREESKLILIIDESHIGKLSDNGNEIRAIIGADLTIEVSATPTFSVSREQEEDGEGAKITVRPKEVIDEEMIKDEIVINEGLTDTASNGKIDIQHIVMRTENVRYFSLALAASIENYEPIRKKEVATKADIEKENAKGQNLLGGIVILSKQNELKLNQQKVYWTTKEKVEDWVFVRDVF